LSAAFAGLKWVRGILLVLPTLAVVGWTFAPAFRAIAAAYTITPVALPANKFDELSWLEFRRGMQKHFSSYDLYVPMDDIVVADPDVVGPDLADLTRKACGDGRLFVWLPLKLRLPLYGAVVWDWCWVPRVTIS